jgi:glycosyltransferase involved in cell wall biosynthesis
MESVNQVDHAPAVIPQISIVIPVHNAEATLRQCLGSIAKNSNIPHEVVVVDDMSSDHSTDIATEYSCRLIRSKSHLMAAACRNLGAAAARSELILFFDADEIMPADCLSEFVAAFGDARVSAVVASFTPDTPQEGYFSKFKNFRHHYIHQRASIDGRTLASGFTAVRKKTFDLCGGFEGPFGPASIEDIALGHKLSSEGFQIVFRPDIQVVHLKAYTLASLLQCDVDRAVSWTVLMLRDRYWVWDLNTGPEQIVSVLAAAGMLISTVLPSVWVGAALTLSFITILIANWCLLRKAYFQFGRMFVLKAALFLPVMYAFHGMGLVGGSIAFALGWSNTLRQPIRHSEPIADVRSKAVQVTKATIGVSRFH